ncbi:MAG: Gfo/Idh/MocA family oxidoreductase [Candidatus Bathyarchaeia archaeon]
MKASVGIVGAGFIAQMRHLPAYQNEKLIKLQAICDPDYRRARQIAKIYNISNVYSSLEDMLSKESLDIIDICSTASTHAPFAIQSLKRGANVIVEKPMAMDLPSAKQVYEAAKLSKKKFTVVQNYRFTKEYKSLKAAAVTGKLGHIDLLYSFFDTAGIGLTDQFLPNYKYGILFETGIHDTDIARDLMGEVVSVKAILTRKSLDGQARSLVSILQHKNKAVSVLRLSFTAATSAHRLEVSGSKVRALLDFEMRSLEFESSFKTSSIKEQIRFATRELSKTLKKIKQHYSNIFWYGMSEFGGLEPFRDIIHQFVLSVLEDTKPPITLEESYTNMKILEACRISLETGQSQRMADLA